MAKFKAGDKVLALKSTQDVTAGKIYEVDNVRYGEIEVRDDRGDLNGLLNKTDWKQVKEATKGTLHALLIEALPQGGYTVTAQPGFRRGPGLEIEKLSAHTTLTEALAFVGRNMR